MSFLYPEVLWGFLSVGIPIIIYLFDLQKPKKVFFTRVARLQQIQEKTSSSHTLKHLVILACRILALILLVLAFAQPILPSHEDSLVKEQIVGLYVDNSFSMSSGTGSTDLLANALQSAQKLSEVFSPSTSFFFLDNEFKSADRQALSRENIQDRLTESTFSPFSRSQDEIYQRQQSVLSEVAGQKAKKIFWFSDFQKSAFDRISKLKIDSSIQLYCVPVQHAEVSNVWVDSVWVSRPIVSSQIPLVLSVKIQNQGTEERKNFAVRLLIDQIQVNSQQIDLAAEGSGILHFKLPIKGQKSQLGTLVFEDQPVHFDNRFYFVLKPLPPISIALIESKPQSSLQQIYKGEPAFKPHIMSASTVAFPVLERSSLVVAQGYNDFNPSLQQALLKKVENGSSLLIIPNVSHNATAEFSLGGQKIYPLKNPVQVPDKIHELAAPNLKNPFFQGVFATSLQDAQDAKMPYSFPQWLLPSGGKTILQHKTGSDFLKVYQKGKGKIFVCSTPLEEPFSSFAKHAIFVPVMYQIALQSVSSFTPLYASLDQSSLDYPLEIAQNEQPFHMVQGQKDLIPEQTYLQGFLHLQLAGSGIQPGFYQLKRKDSVCTTLAFNQGKSESDMHFYSSETLKSLFKNQSNIKVYDQDDALAFSKAYFEQYVGLSLWKYCLLLSLLMLLAEILLLRFWTS